MSAIPSSTPKSRFDVTLPVGAWAVNVLTVEALGFMFLMATSADIKVTV